MNWGMNLGCVKRVRGRRRRDGRKGRDGRVRKGERKDKRLTWCEKSASMMTTKSPVTKLSPCIYAVL